MAKKPRFRKVSMDYALSRDNKVDVILRNLTRLRNIEIQEYLNSYKAKNFEEFDAEISSIIQYYTTYANGIIDEYFDEDELGPELLGFDIEEC